MRYKKETLYWQNGEYFIENNIKYVYFNGGWRSEAVYGYKYIQQPLNIRRIKIRKIKIRKIYG